MTSYAKSVCLRNTGVLFICFYILPAMTLWVSQWRKWGPRREDRGRLGGPTLHLPWTPFATFFLIFELSLPKFVRVGSYGQESRKDVRMDGSVEI